MTKIYEIDIDYFKNHPAVLKAKRPSPFDGTDLAAWGGSVAAVTKGTVAEKVISSCLEDKGYTISDRENTKHDFICNGYKIEVKFSTLNRDGGYIWNQIKLEDDYDRIIFMALDPDRLRVWWCTREEIEKYVIDNNIRPQHANKEVMLTHNIKDIPNVFRKFRLPEAIE